MTEFSIPYKVVLDDLDYLNHVGNAKWLTILERARIDMLEQINYPITRILEQKISVVVSEADIKYIRPAVYGDHLEIRITPINFTQYGVDLNYNVLNKKGKSIFKARVGLVCVDHSGIKTSLPSDLVSLIS
jgi:YbgC/YbaW family acyl-CoA thioester hydrolase